MVTIKESIIEEIITKEKSEGNVLRYVSPNWYLASYNPWLIYYQLHHKFVESIAEINDINFYAKFCELGILWSISFEGEFTPEKQAAFEKRYLELNPTGTPQKKHHFVISIRQATNYEMDIVNDEVKLHSYEKQAVTFKGGLGLYYIDDILIEPALWHSVRDKSITLETWASIENQEIKAATIKMYERIHGENAVNEFFSSKLSLVSEELTSVTPIKEGISDVNKYVLMEGVIDSLDTNDDERELTVTLSQVGVTCPSTGRKFFLNTNPGFTSAKEAVASLMEVPKEVKEGITEINRQGERLMYQISAEMLESVKKGTIDFSKTESLDAETYFNKMKIEA